MDIAFWVMWVIDLLLTFVVIVAGVYREKARAFNNDEQSTYSVVLMLLLVGSIVVRYVIQWPILSLLLAALPLLIVLILYFFDL